MQRVHASSEVLHQWVEDHGDYLFRYSLRYVRNREQAEDLVQECFLAAAKGISGFKGDASERTWLTSILRHKIIDAQRKHSRSPQMSASQDEEGRDLLAECFDQSGHWVRDRAPVDWSLDPERVFEQGEFLAILRDCLSKLPQKLRQVFMLREFDDLSREEICKDLQLSSTNVGVMLHRSRLALRDCLQLNWQR